MIIQIFFLFAHPAGRAKKSGESLTCTEGRLGEQLGFVVGGTMDRTKGSRDQEHVDVRVRGIQATRLEPPPTIRHACSQGFETDLQRFEASANRARDGLRDDL